jgi:hypothetical protein
VRRTVLGQGGNEIAASGDRGRRGERCHGQSHVARCVRAGVRRRDRIAQAAARCQLDSQVSQRAQTLAGATICKASFQRHGFHQLDAVTKRIRDVHTIVAREWLTQHFDPSRAQALDQLSQIAHEQGGVRLARGAKIRFDAEVNLDLPKLEPGATGAGDLQRPRARSARRAPLSTTTRGRETSREPADPRCTTDRPPPKRRMRSRSFPP